MQGLSFNSIKKHPSLIPLYVCLFAGVIGSTGYLMRLALKSPEVTWRPGKKAEPWDDYKNRNYKLYGTPEYKEQMSHAPPKF